MTYQPDDEIGHGKHWKANDESEKDQFHPDLADDLDVTTLRVLGPHWFYWSGIDFYSTDDGGIVWTKWLPNIAFAKSNQAIVNFVAGAQYDNLTVPITFSSVSDGWAIASSANVSLILSTRDAGRHFTAFHSPGATL